MAQLIPKRYATALYDIAMNEGNLQAMEDDAKTALAVFESDKGFSGAIIHPQIERSEKISLLEKAFAGQVSPHLIGLFIVMLNKNREQEIVAVLRRFIKMAEESRKVATARIVSAVPLDDDKRSQIKEKLEKLTGKSVTLKEEVDESILGGLLVSVDGYIMDSTVKSMLGDMKNKLLAI